MLTKRFKISCQEISTRINEIKTKKVEFDGVEKTDISKALILKKEIQTSIQQVKEQFTSVVIIEGKEFPVFSLTISGKTARGLESELKDNNIQMDNITEDILHNSKFPTLPDKEKVNLVRLTISDLGLKPNVATPTIYTTAQRLGLELCHPIVGPYQRLEDKNQKQNNEYHVAMPLIDGHYMFDIYNRETNLRINTRWVNPGDKWAFPNEEFLFQVP